MFLIIIIIVNCFSLSYYYFHYCYQNISYYNAPMFDWCFYYTKLPDKNTTEIALVRDYLAFSRSNNQGIVIDLRLYLRKTKWRMLLEPKKIA